MRMQAARHAASPAHCSRTACGAGAYSVESRRGLASVTRHRGKFGFAFQIKRRRDPGSVTRNFKLHAPVLVLNARGACWAAAATDH